MKIKYFEFGKENEELVVILHGGGVSYQGAEPTAKILARKYHVILVGYDGFNPSEPETEFVSVQYEARKLGDDIVENYNGHIDILYGLSYGGRVLMEVLSDDRLTITTTIADGISLKQTRKRYLLLFLYRFFLCDHGKSGTASYKIPV